MAKHEVKSEIKEVVIIRAKKFNDHLALGLVKLPLEVATVLGKSHLSFEDGEFTIDRKLAGNLNPAHFNTKEA